MRSERKMLADRLRPGSKILDLGCGSCRDALAFIDEGFDVTPVDGSAGMRRVVKERLGIDVVNCKFEDIPWKSEFDAVWASASLLHVPIDDLPGVLEKVSATLKDGGLFYCSFKQSFQRDPLDPRSFTRLDRGIFENLLRGSGFEPIVFSDSASRDGTLWISAVSIRQS